MLINWLSVVIICKSVSCFCYFLLPTHSLSIRIWSNLNNWATVPADTRDYYPFDINHWSGIRETYLPKIIGWRSSLPVILPAHKFKWKIYSHWFSVFYKLNSGHREEGCTNYNHYNRDSWLTCSLRDNYVVPSQFLVFGSGDNFDYCVWFKEQSLHRIKEVSVAQEILNLRFLFCQRICCHSIISRDYW